MLGDKFVKADDLHLELVSRIGPAYERVDDRYFIARIVKHCHGGLARNRLGPDLDETFEPVDAQHLFHNLACRWRRLKRYNPARFADLPGGHNAEKADVRPD